MQPKFLMVAPGKRLSWQYHHRRAEVWRVMTGPVGVMDSLTDEPGPVRTLAAGDMVTMAVEQRHRLIGLDDWGVVAEIWQHTDAAQPSDEADIVRVSDDFGR
jgi:mannose-6-phosphate isomerase